MALKVRLLKDHHVWKKEQVVNLDDTQARYLVRMTVAELAEPEPGTDIEKQLMQHLEEVKPEVKNPIQPEKPKTSTKNAKKKK